MKKLKIIMVLMFILLIGLVSAESNLVHEWTFENTADDIINGVTINSLNGVMNYVTGDTYNSNGVLISSGGHHASDSTNVLSTEVSNLDFSLTNEWSVSLWFDYNQSAMNFSRLFGIDNGSYEFTINPEDVDAPVYKFECNAYYLNKKDRFNINVADGTLINVVCSLSTSDIAYFKINNNTGYAYTPSNPSTTNDALTLGGHSFGIVPYHTTYYSLKIYDKALNETEISNLYLYDNIDGLSTPTYNYSITTSQDPNNLSTDSIGTLRINASVTDSIGNISELNSSYATLNYDVVATANSNCGYINLNDGSCNSFLTSENMINLSSSEFTYFTSELNYLPAVYPFDQEWIQTQVMNEHTIKGSTFIRFNVQNMTTDQNDIVNVEYNIEPYSLLGEYTLLVVYCNSSYTSDSVDPTINPNCALIDEKFPTDDFNHCHSATSCHHVTRLNKDVNWTENGYFFFGTLGTSTTDSWLVNYVENASYTTQSFSLTTNNGVSWTGSDHIADIHLHQFATEDNINYSVTFYDGEGDSITSDNVVDYFDFANAPPSTFVINEPNSSSVYTINSTGVDILIDWEATTDPDGDTIEYKVGLSSNGLQPSENLSEWLNESTTNITYTFNSSEYPHGNYRVFVYARDDQGGQIISPMTGTFAICVSEWLPTEGLCIDGIQNVTYVDSNSCAIEYEKPDSYQQNCTIQDEEKQIFNNILLVVGIMIVLTLLGYWLKVDVLHVMTALIGGVYLALYYIPLIVGIDGDNTIYFVLFLVHFALILTNMLLVGRKD